MPGLLPVTCTHTNSVQRGDWIPHCDSRCLYNYEKKRWLIPISMWGHTASFHHVCFLMTTTSEISGEFENNACWEVWQYANHVSLETCFYELTELCIRQVVSSKLCNDFLQCPWKEKPILMIVRGSTFYSLSNFASQLWTQCITQNTHTHTQNLFFELYVQRSLFAVLSYFLFLKG